ncbi:MAG: hypothetical protein A2506_03755 [Elusimicrobia bacterium RIFOXYD12_FULL_66_9]|nr:MAG: hypothetical protein A2506_03755 [Elusimicrobia bacterium RIFOXYD12_FULL_66_9]
MRLHFLTILLLSATCATAATSADPAHPPIATLVSTMTTAQQPPAYSLLARAAAKALEGAHYQEASDLAERALKAEPGNREALAVLQFSKGRSAVAPSKSAPTRQPVAVTDERPLKPQIRTRSAVAPPDELYRPALATLSKSATGKQIVDFLGKQKIPVVIQEGMQSDAAAAYYPSSRIIAVPPTFFSEPLIVQAVVLGHEGFHAIQDIEYHSAVTLETEIDAWERQGILYQELRHAGVVPAPDEHFVVQAHGLFQAAAGRGNLYQFESWVEANYKESARANKRAMLRGLPGPLREAGYRLLDSFPWPAFRSSQHAHEQQGLLSRLTGKDEELRNAIKHHQENKSWIIERTR